MVVEQRGSGIPAGLRQARTGETWEELEEVTDKGRRGAVSRPICDPIEKELEGPTKDRPAY